MTFVAVRGRQAGIDMPRFPPFNVGNEAGARRRAECGAAERRTPQKRVAPSITASHSFFSLVQWASSSPFSVAVKISMCWSAMFRNARASARICAGDVVAVTMMRGGKVMPEGSSVGSTSPATVKEESRWEAP